MVIISFDGSRGLLEAYVIKTGKRCSINVLDSMVGDEKVFFPTHEYEIGISERFIIKRIGIKSFCVLDERAEFTLIMI